jgi:hypothetical protein
MADNGVIFSDGMEMDYLAFNAGGGGQDRGGGEAGEVGGGGVTGISQ